MKREDLKKIEGLTDTQIDSIMQLHGNDVTSWNAKIQEKDNQIKAKDTQISDISTKLKSYDGIDVAKLQEDLKNAQSKYDTDIAQIKLDNAIQNALKDSKARNVKALSALLDLGKVSLDEQGNLIGLSDQIENVKKDNSYLFDIQDNTDNQNQDVNLGGDHSNHNSSNAQQEAINAAFGIK